ncbi:MAG TPA: hypothetical protein VK428_03875 [Acidimicrobiales bacterium]|nr:hypothetical protein [Acidimicrobiales bacterium]
MPRRTFDLIVTVGGVLLLFVLIAAGALGLWGYEYANSNVHNQLAYQDVTFPTMAEINIVGSVNWKERSFISQYAGQEVLSGPQAKAYAEKIRMDVWSLPDHGVFSKVSAAAIAASEASKAAPTNTALAAQATTLLADRLTAFEGSTLQGLLLEAYAFWTIGQVALVGAIVAFSLAFVMLILIGLGVWHFLRTPEDVPFPRSHHNEERVLAGV